MFDQVFNGSSYLRNGAPLRCALCNASFLVEDQHVKCWRGKDQRYYCCREHAEFGLEKALASFDPFMRKAS
jgi:hypothetical protein